MKSIKNISPKIKNCILNPKKCRTKTCNKLNSLMHKVCDKKGLSCKGNETYIPLKLKKTQLQTCKVLRYAVSVCHGKKNDPSPAGHTTQNTQVDNRINTCDKYIKKCDWF